MLICWPVPLSSHRARVISLRGVPLPAGPLGGNDDELPGCSEAWPDIAIGLGDPGMSGMPQLQYVVKGVRRNLAGRPRRTRLPITPELLSLLRSSWEHMRVRADATMLWAAATLAFFDFLRMGEVGIPSGSGFDPWLHLAYGDVRVDSVVDPSWLAVTIKQSKTDPLGKGVTLSIGATGSALCPVAAMLGYMVERGSAPGPLFLFHDRRPLTRDRFVACMRSALAEAGIDSSLYAGHSFRIGVATTAAMRGLQGSLIKTLGRWESSAYALYIHTPRSTLISVAMSLVSPS